MFQLDSGFLLSPGEFRLVSDAIERWPVEITFTEINGHSLKFTNEKARFEVAFSNVFDEEIAKELRVCSWQGNDNLKVMASMIPRDTVVWEKMYTEIDCRADQFESFVGHIHGKDTWKAKQDFWIKNREYRELMEKKEQISARIPQLGTMISSEKLEFYLSFDDNHDICQTDCQKTPTI
jgi:hypothetical protein